MAYAADVTPDIMWHPIPVKFSRFDVFYAVFLIDMDVSKNSGTPKWMV